MLYVAVTTTPNPTPEPLTDYQIATWCLVGVAIITAFTLIGLAITLWKRVQMAWGHIWVPGQWYMSWGHVWALAQRHCSCGNAMAWEQFWAAVYMTNVNDVTEGSVGGLLVMLKQWLEANLEWTLWHCENGLRAWSHDNYHSSDILRLRLADFSYVTRLKSKTL